MLAFCSSPRFVDHHTGPFHPERPARIDAVLRAVETAPLAQLPGFTRLEPSPAHPRWLQTVHTHRHIECVKRASAAGGGVLDLGDTVTGPSSYDIALLALGAVLKCTDEVMQGRARRAFAAVRPPGHHAEPDRAMGFCLFSNVAIAARYLQEQYGVRRIAIVDFDVHHGNGTQAAFQDDDRVFFISLHQHPETIYPGTGFEWEIGTGRGRGYTLNLPFAPGSGDAEYLRVMETRVLPELEEFDPQVLLISAGFDGHRDDPLAQTELTEDAFEMMTRQLVALADRHCAGRVISALEGGYHLRALASCVLRHLGALM